MPYEATVPVHRRLLWPAVTDPERLLGALPNVSIDASGAQGVAGRLRVRTREQTVTFRGVARIVEVVPSALRVSLEVEAVFGRTGGSVEGVIEIALRQSGSGTRVIVGGQVDIAPGAGALTAQALDSVFQRVVQRWFATLAESSPAGPRERGDKASAQERAPLAVVRDVPADASASNAVSAPVPRPAPSAPDAAAPDQAGSEQVGDGESEEPVQPPVEVEPEPPAHTPLHLVALKHDETTSDSDSDSDADSDADFSSGSDSGSDLDSRSVSTTETTDESDDAAANDDALPENVAIIEPDAASESAPAHDSVIGPDPTADPAPPAKPIGDGLARPAAEAAQPEADDIWSRLRDRSMPPWIPFLVGAATATLAALVLLFAALRRAARHR